MELARGASSPPNSNAINFLPFALGRNEKSSNFKIKPVMKGVQENVRPLSARNRENHMRGAVFGGVGEGRQLKMFSVFPPGAKNEWKRTLSI